MIVAFADLRPKGKTHDVSIQTIINPDIDVDALARTLMDLVASMSPEERARLAEAGRKRREQREKGGVK